MGAKGTVYRSIHAWVSRAKCKSSSNQHLRTCEAVAEDETHVKIETGKFVIVTVDHLRNALVVKPLERKLTQLLKKSNVPSPS